MGSHFNDGYLVPNPEQKLSPHMSHAANESRGLTARMPLICAKSPRIQSHDRIGDESEKLDRQTQF
jgi:hypothetical protein